MEIKALKIISMLMRVFGSIALMQVGDLWGFGIFKVVAGLFLISAVIDIIVEIWLAEK